MQYLVILLLFLGLALAATEIFIPGFGIMGVLGIIFIVMSAVFTIVHFPFGLLIVGAELAFLCIVFWVLIKWAKERQLYGSLVLKDILAFEKKEVENNDKLIGKEGVAVVPLKPFGAVEFNGVKLDAYSEGAYIPKGRVVTVVNVDSGRIIVKEMN